MYRRRFLPGFTLPEEPQREKDASYESICRSFPTLYSTSFDAPALRNSIGCGPGALIVGKANNNTNTASTCTTGTANSLALLLGQDGPRKKDEKMGAMEPCLLRPATIRAWPTPQSVESSL